ncbi:MAG: divergent polysaccharide deacetylase family protein [bacterium]|nr:divergent polysaccharide deacetylase family protein [bacterium]
MSLDDTPDPGERAALPYSWVHIIGALVAFTLAGAGIIFLIAAYVKTRPMDLTAPTIRLAQDVEKLLVDSRVPKDAIQQAQPTMRKDHDATWLHHEIDVKVPHSLTVEGVEKLLRRNLPSNDVEVVGLAPAATATRVLSLALAGREFAVVRLAPPEKQNLVTECERVASEALALIENGPSPPQRATRTIQRRENRRATWVLTEIRADLAADADLDVVRARLSQTLGTRAGIDILERPSSGQTQAAMTIAYQGLPCADLVITAVQPAPQLPEVELPRLGPVPEEETEDDPEEVLTPKNVPELAELPLESNGLHESELAPVFNGRPDAHTEPQIAIIVDDGGRGDATSDAILALEPVLTLAILPYDPESTETAKRAKKLGFEVLLHMPMETGSKTAKYPHTIKADMDKKQIGTLTEKALAEVPGAVGINNHTGSVFTSNEKSMTLFLELIKEKSLFFVDSRTTAETVGIAVAEKVGIKAVERDVFLDNKPDRDYIRGQFKLLEQAARKYGAAVGICHFRPASAAVLAEEIPRLKKKGVKIVHVSELVQ